ncbi:Polymerase/histidinol phosphatase-like protein [Pseudoneurospora amorphoporcata]|uniref:Histidinol-phosphatase n=1 Tax=Pseudoneurospora amorphoporcata TaxID=241081 RepID=A0AAN6NYG0_9PEZI|nr:Polymerase/histidinol phosphatase-like protein [Pseudoneurospora amorphoporcata]
MAFTMHSHSGQFCPGHAKDQLEEVIKHAISVGYKTMGLTEHMPRTQLSDLYPEELDPDNGKTTLANFIPNHASYLAEAQRLQAKYASQIHILIGFEGEWIRGSEYGPLISSLLSSAPCVDYFIGSIHHTARIPIDFDKAMFLQAQEACGGEEEKLWEKYYDEQHEMLNATKPKVVGHFDLIRLFSEQPDRRVKGWRDGAWNRMKRNLEVCKGLGAWLEVNTSALRKGLKEPYPGREVAEEWIKMGGKFTFSDDSHGIAQVATNYTRGLDYLESLGVTELWTLERVPHPGTEGDVKSELRDKAVTIAEFRQGLRLEQ